MIGAMGYVFDRAFEITLGQEGGVSTDKNDAAGDGSGRPHTNFGITLKAVQDLDKDGHLLGHLRDAFDFDRDGDIDFDDVPGWTVETAKLFYEQFYWTPLSPGSFSSAIAITLFDAAVNMGKSAAIKTMQRALRVAPDGVIGKATIAAANKRAKDDSFIGEMLAQRLEACRTFKTANIHFLGWSRRCFDVHLAALKENY